MPRWIRVLLPLFVAVGLASVLLVDYGESVAQSAEPELRPGQEFLRVNELMASNKKTLVDPNETGQTPDWIEIYNASSDPVSLDGLALADGEPLDGGFPITNGLVISPGGFMLFYADGDTKQGPQHTNFKLNGDSGESVILYEFAPRQEIQRVDFPPLGDDIAFGFKPDGSGEPKILDVATPGISNSSNPPHISNLTPPPYPAPTGATVAISATVTDTAVTASATPYATDALTVTLYYSTTLTTSYQALPMTAVGPDTYESLIPAQAADTLVSYYVQAVDGNGEISRLPLPGREARYLTGYVAPHLIINEIVVENSEPTLWIQTSRRKPRTGLS